MDKQPAILSRRLSGLDAAFLYLERKEIPLNIAAVAMFDGPLPFRKFVANIESKLEQLPRYRQVVVAPPLNLGYPTWEYDQDFDIGRHIFRVRLSAPGGEEELEALAGRLLSQVLDRNKPLWEIHVVEGLKDGRGALIARIHHALADGVAGAALLRIMLDSTPEGSHPPRRSRIRTAIPPRSEHTLAEQIGGAIQSALENAVAAETGLLSLADGLLSERGKDALHELAGLLPELLQPPERFPFNKPCSGERKFCWAEVDFSHVQSIRAALGGKVNDCILSVVVRAISRYIRLHGEKVTGRFLRVVCPVNLRGDEQGESLGNRITFLPVVLPLDIRDPAEMLHVVTSRMEIMKNVRAAELVAIAASCMSVTPAPLQELFWRGIPLIPLPLPLLNIICTNVPGSPSALYTVGRRLLAAYPHVPTGYELGLGVAVQSYDGKLFFGVTADAHVAPDVGRLRDFILKSFRELCRAAGIKSPRAGRRPAATPPAAKLPTTRRRNPVRPVQPLAPVNGTSRPASALQPATEFVVPPDAAPSANGNGQTPAPEEASFEPAGEAVLV
ncbi:MAG: wax ester/triacylglycerol synthase family O-acyltransferase [Candidatus Solibacter sp.]